MGEVELRKIPGYDSAYLAGSDGFIYSTKRGNPVALKGRLTSGGNYFAVWAYPVGASRVTRSVHTLILEAYHGPKPGDDYSASHKNGNSYDNRPDNLIWEKHAENLSRKFGHGTHDRGLNNSRACITIEQLSVIRTLLEDATLTQAQIADQFGISRTMVTRIKNGKKYADF